MKRLWQSIRNNWGLKLAALFFAVLIWSFVISVQDPLRARRLENVPLRVIGLQSIEDAGLIVRNSELLNPVTMVVDVRISDTNRFNLSTVTVTADLSQIQRKGTYDIYLSGQTMVGEVVSVTPSVISLDVDERITREIPVSYAYSGQLSDALIHMEPTLSASVIEITGAQKDVALVSSAVAVIDLSGVTESVKNSYNLSLLDKNNQPVSSDLFVNTLPAVTVKMEVFHKRTLGIASDPEQCIEDLSAIADGYQITNISFSQATIIVYGTKEAIDALPAYVTIRPVKVNGLRATKTFEVFVLLPKGIMEVSYTPIHMTVTITKK
jgi:YbbR domain-containing protein